MERGFGVAQWNIRLIFRWRKGKDALIASYVVVE